MPTKPLHSSAADAWGLIAIIGSPRAGKTTLACRLSVERGVPVVHADDMIGLGWSDASTELARLMAAADGACVWEGVMVVRALRKALLDRPGPPVDRCIVLERPWLALTPGQAAMRRGCATILRSIEPELVARGVAMERR